MSKEYDFLRTRQLNLKRSALIARSAGILFSSYAGINGIGVCVELSERVKHDNSSIVILGGLGAACVGGAIAFFNRASNIDANARIYEQQILQNHLPELIAATTNGK